VTGAKIKAGAVGTAALANGAVTGAKINPSGLGTVPSANHANTATSAGTATTAGDAATLQGKPANSFVQGEGQIFGNTVQLSVGQKGVPVFDIPGFGPLSARCEPSGKGNTEGYFHFDNASGAKLGISLFYDGGSDGGTIGAGDYSEVGGNEVIGSWRWTFTTLSGPPRMVTLDLAFDGNGTPTDCLLTAQATISR
jgi:hypothetical protein